MGGRQGARGSESYVLGVQIGGSQRRVALARLDGEIVREQSVSGPLAEPSRALDELAEQIAACVVSAGITLEQIARAGCAFSGPVESDSGVVLHSHRFPEWDNLPLGSLLEEALGAIALVDNNARVAALGEARFGAGRGERHLLYLHLDQGLGGALVLNGRPYHGASATAGEIGHMLVAEGGPRCSCGKPGHLEAFASASAITRRTERLLQERDANGPLAEHTRAGMPLTPKVIFEAAHAGDETAHEVVDEAVHLLGIALANLVTVLNPGVVVVGGVVAEAGPLLFEPLRAHLRRYTMEAPGRAVRLVPTALWSDSVLRGAVALALTSLAWDEPSLTTR